MQVAPTNQSTNQSTNQPTNQLSDQPTNQGPLSKLGLESGTTYTDRINARSQQTASVLHFA